MCVCPQTRFHFKVNLRERTSLIIQCMIRVWTNKTRDSSRHSKSTMVRTGACVFQLGDADADGTDTMADDIERDVGSKNGDGTDNQREPEQKRIFFIISFGG